MPTDGPWEPSAALPCSQATPLLCHKGNLCLTGQTVTQNLWHPLGCGPCLCSMPTRWLSLSDPSPVCVQHLPQA